MNEVYLSNTDLQFIVPDPQTGELTVPKEIIAAIKNNEHIKREVKAFDEEFKKRLKEAMEYYGIDKIESDELTVSYVGEYTSTRVDTTKLKKEYPKAYYGCQTESEVSASVRVRLK